ncbi:MAG: transposase, partial [Saprospiraceae bacterium]
MYDKEEVEFLEDSLVYLHSGRGSKKISTPLRLIKIKRISDGEKFCVVTNIINESAFEIANIYRKRWDIEVLFRFLKQEMNLNHILCHDSNALQNIIYLLLIAAMMILIYRKRNKIKSYKTAKNRFF